MSHLVKLFVDGSDVNYDELLSLRLICKISNGYQLTQYGASFLSK